MSTVLVSTDGRWRVEAVTLDRGRGAGPESLYRVSEYGCARGYCRTPDELDELGVPVAELVDAPAPAVVA